MPFEKSSTRIIRIKTVINESVNRQVDSEVLSSRIIRINIYIVIPLLNQMDFD